MSRYLDMVDSPVQVKKLTLDQLQELGQEIRQELITGLARTIAIENAQQPTDPISNS